MENQKHQRICPVTNQILPEDSHGNRRYQNSSEVEKTVRDNANHLRYNKIRNIGNQALRLDKILEKYYPLSNEIEAIPVYLLTNERFDWDFCSAKTKNKQGIINWVIDYGFLVPQKNKIIIYYGNNPLQQF